MVFVYGSKCFCRILISGLVKVEVCVYVSKVFCDVLVRRAKSGMCLWVKCLCEVILTGLVRIEVCV